MDKKEKILCYHLRYVVTSFFSFQAQSTVLHLESRRRIASKIKFSEIKKKVPRA